MKIPKERIKKSLSLEVKTVEELHELCEVLGVNSHNYMINVVCKAIQHDRIALNIEKDNRDMRDKILGMFEELTTK